MSSSIEPAQEAADELTAAFESLLRRLEGFVQIAPEAADGYITAVACSPRAWAIEAWLPALFDDGFERCFADPADAAWARDILERWRARIAQALVPVDHEVAPDRVRLQPYLVEWDAAAREAERAQGATEDELRTMHMGAVWAAGFLLGMSKLLEQWDGDLGARQHDAIEDLMQHVGALLIDAGSPEAAAHAAAHFGGRWPSRDVLLDVALLAVQDLHVLLLDISLTPAPRRVAHKVGRNDPCPCGSGRKYKKCCGATAEA